MIAFFGMGLLGSNFVRALRRRGEEVRVWNRTASRARALEEVGAKAFDDPAEAARGADRIHLTLSDDAAVDAVLDQARSGIAKGALILDHTTTSSTSVPARVAQWDALGIPFVHAPVFMGPQNALEGTGMILVSGETARVERARPLLAPMTGKVVSFGPKPETAAAFKLLGNLHLMFLTAGLADMLALAKALGVAPTEAATLFDHFNPGTSVAARLARMTDAAFANPSWELSMARKDARIMVEEAARADVPLAVLPAIAARMDALIAEGHGGDDWTILGKGFVGK
jgi:3-hydroxyisobutyrate dehydrogenase